MSDDLLKQYTSALRQEYDGASAAPEATRARVIRTLAEQRPRRAKWWTVGIPLLALLGGSTAWAAASGQLGHIMQQASLAIGFEIPGAAGPARPEQKPRIKGTGKPVELNQQAQDPARQPDVVVPELVPPKPEQAASLKSQQQPVGRQQTETLSPEALAQKTLRQEQAAAIAAYKKGHDAHFAAGNCAQAIAAYSDYLARYPTDSFTLEARYNRAACLIQVGQLEQAKSDLRPFAQGLHGDYRKKQAQSLLEALGQATGSSDDPQ